MGKKKAQSSNLGKSIIRSRFGKNVNKNGESFLHTSELSDGYDWGRLNLQSVTEQSNLDDFLATAELAGTEFAAEKLNVKFVDPFKNSGVLSKDELRDVTEAQEKHRQLLRIPRRPPWDCSTSAEELESRERATFLDWRRKLAELQEVENLHLTPYEKNLDFWRQLWRVIERSDVVVQIVDARNPMLFRCADLERYVKEVNPDKVNLVLINKADYLTDTQRELWAEYFQEEGIMVAFWSALEESKKQEEKESGGENEENVEDSEMESDDEDSVGSQRADNSRDCSSGVQSSLPLTENNGNDTTSAENLDENNQMNSFEMCDNADSKTNLCTISKNKHSKCENFEPKCEASNFENCSQILTGEELLELFRSIHKSRKVNENYTTVGMVGYPNVGKSSTINAILKMKKVPVSATPGRTKHFQTLFVDSDLMLCDCPGLVFPSFVTTKAELVVNGILPIDQMRDHVPPVSLVCQRIPRPVLEGTYGINIPVPGECEDPDRPPTAPELLNAHGYMRGYMTARGLPDNPRSSRYVLKDYVNGKLLFCHPPPGVESDVFHSVTEHVDVPSPNRTEYALQMQVPKVPESKMDKDFFKQSELKLHSKGVRGVSDFARSSTTGQHIPSGSGDVGGSNSSLAGKPWKKHNNRNKKEKSRRIHGYMDE